MMENKSMEIRGDSSRNIILEKGWKCQKGTREQQIGLKKKWKKKKKVSSGDVDGIHPTSERLNEQQTVETR